MSLATSLEFPPAVSLIIICGNCTHQPCSSPSSPSRLPSGQRASSACKALLCDLNWLGDGTDNTAYVSEWRLVVSFVLTEPTSSSLDRSHSPFFFFSPRFPLVLVPSATGHFPTASILCIYFPSPICPQDCCKFDRTPTALTCLSPVLSSSVTPPQPHLFSLRTQLLSEVLHKQVSHSYPRALPQRPSPLPHLMRLQVLPHCPLHHPSIRSP